MVLGWLILYTVVNLYRICNNSLFQKIHGVETVKANIDFLGRFEANILLKVDTPETFKDDNDVIWLSKTDIPLTFKLLTFNVVALDNELRLSLIPNTDKPDEVILPITFNEDRHVVAPFNFVVPLSFKLFKLV